MTTRTLLIFCIAAAGLTAKNRDWQTGQLLDKGLNPYFRVTETSASGSKTEVFATSESGEALVANARRSDGDIVYENYVIEAADKAYLVELAHFKTFKAPRLSVGKPITFAVEKDKLWLTDLDRGEYETKVLKQIDRQGVKLAGVSPAAPQAAAPAKADQVKPDPSRTNQAKTDQAKIDQAKIDQAKTDQAKPEQAKVDKPKASKTDPMFTTGTLSQSDLNPTKPAPAPAVIASAVKPKQAVAAPVQTKPDVKPADVKQPDAKSDVPAAKAPPLAPERISSTSTAKTDAQPARVTGRDRAWQSGQLLSAANNNYFINVTYTSDTDGSAWPFSQGSDGRLTVTGQVGLPTNNPYTYDNYVIESQFVAYLVQRMRPKTSPTATFPGTKPLKFAVEKTKLWVLDEEGKEYETKVVKLVQKDSIVNPLERASAR